MISHARFNAAVNREIKYHQVRMASDYVKGLVYGLKMALEIGTSLNRVFVREEPATIKDPLARMLYGKIVSAYRRLFNADRKGAMAILRKTILMHTPQGTAKV